MLNHYYYFKPKLPSLTGSWFVVYLSTCICPSVWDTYLYRKCISYLLYYLNGNGGFNVVRDADGYSYICYLLRRCCRVIYRRRGIYRRIHLSFIYLFFFRLAPSTPKSTIHIPIIYLFHLLFVSFLLSSLSPYFPSTVSGADYSICDSKWRHTPFYLSSSLFFLLYLFFFFFCKEFHF